MNSNWSLILDSIQSKINSNFNIPVVVHGENIQTKNNYILIKPLNTELVESFATMKTYNYITQVDLNIIASENNKEEMDFVLDNLQQMEDIFDQSRLLTLANNNKAFNVEFAAATLDAEPGDYYVVRWELNAHYSVTTSVDNVPITEPEDNYEDDVDDNNNNDNNDIGTLLGDANLDGQVNVSDVVLIISFILSGQNPTLQNYQNFVQNSSNVDMNNDGDINVTDIVNLVNQILT